MAKQAPIARTTPQRADQRARILDAATRVISDQGYAQARIGDIASRAGVSRATFYELFGSKESCFLALHEGLAAQTRERIAITFKDTGSGRAGQACVAELAVLAEQQPHSFACLFHEATVAGTRALEKRQQLLSDLAEPVERAERRSSRGSAPDIPPRLLIGASVRTIGMAMRRGESDLAGLGQELLAWSEAYATRASKRRWQRVETAPEVLASADSAHFAPALTPAQSTPRGRHRLPADAVRRSQRERLLYGTAATIGVKGYEHSTVADIVAAAGLSRDVFYSHLRSREDALEQAAKLFFELSMATMAGAFFTVDGVWHERVWAAGKAFAEFLREAPEFVRLGLIEASAPGPDAARRSDELLLGFTVFIEPGAAPGEDVVRVAPRAILAGLTETALQLLVEERVDELPGLLPLATYLTVAPFIGVGDANRFVERQLAALRQSAGSGGSS